MTLGAQTACPNDKPLAEALAVHTVDPDMAQTIEHDDFKLDQLEGLQPAAETLNTAYATAGI